MNVRHLKGRERNGEEEEIRVQERVGGRPVRGC